MIDDDISAVSENELLRLAASLIPLRGWVPRDAAVSLVLAGYETARVVALPPTQRIVNRPSVQVGRAVIVHHGRPLVLHRAPA